MKLLAQVTAQKVVGPTEFANSVDCHLERASPTDILVDDMTSRRKPVASRKEKLLWKSLASGCRQPVIPRHAWQFKSLAHHALLLFRAMAGMDELLRRELQVEYGCSLAYLHGLRRAGKSRQQYRLDRDRGKSVLAVVFRAGDRTHAIRRALQYSS